MMHPGNFHNKHTELYTGYQNIAVMRLFVTSGALLRLKQKPPLIPGSRVGKRTDMLTKAFTNVSYNTRKDREMVVNGLHSVVGVLALVVRLSLKLNDFARH
jgi:hypothetical protein